MRLLIAEDDKALGMFLSRGLEADGHRVRLAHDGGAAVEAFRQEMPDLTILDLNMPVKDGEHVLAEVRAMDADLPVLVLTARQEVDTRVRCLDLGADDLMTKPFSLHELRARCRALLRRKRETRLQLRAGDLELDRLEHTARRGGQPVVLTNKEFSLLEHLLLNRGQCVTRVELLDSVWNLEPAQTTNIVDVYVTRNTEADITVVGLVGERGREVGEFLADSLGDEGRARSVVLVATSDESPLQRMRAALAATTVAEFFAARGKHVLLVLDSLTRFAMAAREIGLAAGEPPTAKGYTPSVFTRLARLVERAGEFRSGSITAFYTVLMEGDDQQDPLVDAVRSLLDGHVVLSRTLAAEGWYPPIEVLDSISRLMSVVAAPAHREQAALLRKLMAVYARSEDLVRIGAYKPGADPDLDRALRARAATRGFLTQASSDHVVFTDCLARLATLAAEI
jgi:DNA-binding response OmpR family regulator